jgi:phosphatidylglycerophosphate synthase
MRPPSVPKNPRGRKRRPALLISSSVTAVQDDGRDAARPPRAVSFLDGLTICRLLLVPVLMSTLMVRPAVTTIALLVFMFADLFDGVLARARNSDNARRRVLDCVVDRVSIDACLLAATLSGALPAVLLVAFLVRDLYCATISAGLMYRRRIVLRVDAPYKVPSFLFAAWAISAPLVSPQLRTVFASVTLAACLALAVDLTRLILRMRTLPEHRHLALASATAVRAGREGRAGARGSDVSDHHPLTSTGLPVPA